MMLIVVAGLLIIALLCFWLANKVGKVADQLESSLNNREAQLKKRLKADALYEGNQLIAFRAIDQSIIIEAEGKSHTYGFGDLVECRVIRDGGSVTKTNRGSQIAGMTVGAAVLGPLGALVGGLSASKRTQDKISQITLQLVVDDPDCPIHDIVFYQALGSGKALDAAQTEIQLADKFYAHCVNAMRIARAA